MPSARDTGASRPDTTTDPNRPSGASPNPARPNLGQGSPPMSEADREHTTHRRGLLTGTLAALLTGAAAVATAKDAPLMPPPGDDAELLTVAQDFWKQDAIVAQWERRSGHRRDWRGSTRPLVGVPGGDKRNPANDGLRVAHEGGLPPARAGGCRNLQRYC
jgi:hypothetical protein